MSVKLYNKGKRTIEHLGKQFLPGMTASFTPEGAKKLKRLYPTELVSVEDEIARFDNAEEIPDATAKAVKGDLPYLAETEDDGDDSDETDGEETKEEVKAPNRGGRPPKNKNK